jgi:hypothetical protein
MESNGYRKVLMGDETDEEINRKVFAQLVLALDDENTRRISMTCDDDGHAAWNLLCQHYQGTDQLRLNNLRCELLTTKCFGAEDVDNFILKIKDLCEQINWSTKDKVTDEEKKQYVLRGLPQDYESFITTVQMMPDEGFEKFEERLKTFTRNRNFQINRDSSGGSESALYAGRRAGGFRPRSRNGNDKRKCYNCGKIGHIQRDCEQEGATRPKRVEETNIAFAFTVLEDSKSGRGEWIIDSGASSHMCRDKASFFDLKPLRKNIWLADGRITEVHGVGTVVLPVKDKKGKVHFTGFMNTLFVPGLRHNLFSVQKAIKKGYGVIFSSKGCVIKTEDGTEFPLQQRGQAYTFTEAGNASSKGSVSKNVVYDDENDDWHPDIVPVKKKQSIKKEFKSPSEDEFKSASSTPVKKEKAYLTHMKKKSAPIPVVSKKEETSEMKKKSTPIPVVSKKEETSEVPDKDGWQVVRKKRKKEQKNQIVF